MMKGESEKAERKPRTLKELEECEDRLFKFAAVSPAPPVDMDDMSNAEIDMMGM